MSRFAPSWIACLVVALPLGALAGLRPTLLPAVAELEARFPTLPPAEAAPPRSLPASAWPSAAAASPSAEALSQAGTQLWLPMLNYTIGMDVCETWIDAQNVGAASGSAILVTWSDDRQEGGTLAPEVCASECDGPLGVTCSGLLAPGMGWAFLGAQIPAGSASGTLLSVVDAPLSALGGTSTMPALAALCSALGGRELDERGWSVGGVQADCAGWRSFQVAWRTGGTWQDLPLGAIRGGDLAARVHRTCPGSLTPGLEVTSTYPALADAALAAGLDAAGTTYRQMLLGARRDRDLGDSAVSVQNAGEACASITLWLAPNDACRRPSKPCATYRLEPGQAMTWDLGTAGRAASIAGCPEEIPFAGHLWIESDQPIATAGDHIAADLLASHVGVPWPPPAPPSAVDGMRGDLWLGRLPLVLGPSKKLSEVRLWVGAESEADLVFDASLSVNGLTEAITQTLRTCGTGSAEISFYTEPLSEPSAAMLRVRARAAEAGDADAARRITAMAEVIEIAPGFVPRSAYRARLSISDRPTTSRLAFGGARNDLRGSGLLEELVIANTASAATEIVLRFFDVNGPTVQRCQPLEAGAVAWFNPQDARHRVAMSGLWSSVIVEAVAWVGDAPEDGSGFALEGAVLTRKGTTALRDIPGDETALTAAIPLSADPPDAPPPWPGADSAPPCPAPGDPYLDAPPSPAEAALTWLPTLRQQDRWLSCSYEIVVRNEAASPMIAVLVDWTSLGFCPPMCAGFRGVTCSPLLAPGGTWQPGEPDLDAESRSAAVLGLGTESLRDLGLPPRSDALAAELLCARLIAAAQPEQRGPCLAWTELLAAWRAGAEYQGLPLSRLVGGPVAVSVQRECEHPPESGTPVTSRYEAPSGMQPSSTETWPDRHVASVFPAYANAEAPLPGEARTHSVRTRLFLQNAGTACGRIDVHFEGAPHAAGGQCTPTSRCRLWLAPGETYDFYVTDCVPSDWQGTVTLISDQPLAVISHIMGDDRDLSVPAAPWLDAFDLDRDGDRDAEDRAPLLAAAGAAPGDPRWRAWLDLHRDGLIDETDVRVLERWLPGAGPPCPTTTPTVTPTGTAIPTRIVTATPTPTARASATPSPVPAIILPWGGTGRP